MLHHYKASKNEGKATIQSEHVRFWSEWFVYISFGGVYDRIGGFRNFKEAEAWLLGCDSDFHEV